MCLAGGSRLASAGACRRSCATLQRCNFGLADDQQISQQRVILLYDVDTRCLLDDMHLAGDQQISQQQVIH